MNTPHGFNMSEDFQTCQMYGYWGYEHAHPAGGGPGIESIEGRKAASIGTCYHTAIEAFDKEPDPEIPYKAFEGAWQAEVEAHPDLESVTEETLALSQKMILSYLLTYQGDPVEHIASEVEFNVLLKDPRTGRDWPYTGKIDKVGRYKGYVVGFERKTTSFSPAQFFPQFTLHRGISGYVYGLQALYPDLMPSGIVVEVCGKPRSKHGDCWNMRELILRGPAQLRLWHDEQCAIFRAIERCQKGEEPWVRNTRFCENWYHKTCQYQPLCLGGGPGVVEELIQVGYVGKEWK